MNLKSDPTRHRACAGIGALTLMLGLAACGGGTGSESTAATADGRAGIASARTGSAGSAPMAPAALLQDTEGRLLASNCFQCHDTNGTGGFDSIRGSDAREVLEFLNKPASRNIMAAHAQGYTPEQLQKVIAYLQQ